MSLYEFGKNDLFYNRIKTYPSLNFYIYNGTVLYNNGTKHIGELSGDFVKHVSPGQISLYELNIDRPTGELIYPFISKDGSLTSFKTITTKNYNNDFVYGDEITGSYPLNAGLSFERFGTNVTGSSCKFYRDALKNSLNRNSILSQNYLFSSSLGDKGTQEIKIISIPSIFYGSTIKKGTCSLRFYISGALVNELKDTKRNGELRQQISSSTADSGSVGGVVLYDEGFIILTGSWNLADDLEDYGRGSSTKPRWLDFGYTGSISNDAYSSYQIAFSGTNYVPTTTMLAHAPRGELNYSNNNTFLKHSNPKDGQTLRYPVISTGSAYKENDKVDIVNITKTNFSNPNGKFEKTTYISKIGIYDKDRNLIAIANLATPVRKREKDQFTFKLKMDF